MEVTLRRQWFLAPKVWQWSFSRLVLQGGQAEGVCFMFRIDNLERRRINRSLSENSPQQTKGFASVIISCKLLFFHTNENRLKHVVYRLIGYLTSTQFFFSASSYCQDLFGSLLVRYSLSLAAVQVELRKHVAVATQVALRRRRGKHQELKPPAWWAGFVSVYAFLTLRATTS